VDDCVTPILRNYLLIDFSLDFAAFQMLRRGGIIYAKLINRQREEDY
jgi:hypothetical protein